MAIQCQCPACSQRFQVPESALGKRVKCPKCAVVVQLNLPKGEPPSSETQPPQWFVRTASQKQHGPMPKAKLDQLVAEGRLDAFCHVRQADWEKWKPIEEVYPQFAVGDAPTDSPESMAASPEAEPRLHPCPDCGKIVSRRATECPNCGCPIGPPAVTTLPRRTSSARKPSGTKRNRKIALLASAGVVLLMLAGTVVYFGVQFWHQVQSANDALKLVTEPLAPAPVEPEAQPGPVVDKPTPEQVAACMKDSAAAMAREVDQRFEREYNAVAQLAQLQGDTEAIRSLAEEGFGRPSKKEPGKTPSAPPPARQPYLSQYDALYRECLAYLQARFGQNAKSLAEIQDAARQWASEKHSALESQLLKGLSTP
ncbi:MAG: GYF domain-containing protein [Planctomycetia bacterium]|nr:GYF domain-containing protein [Planctomycetia bacterium]